MRTLAHIRKKLVRRIAPVDRADAPCRGAARTAAVRGGLRFVTMGFAAR
jgi:hypothetical protein